MKRWVVFKAVFIKTLIEMNRYRVNTIAGFVTMYIIFVLLFFGAKAIGGETFKTGANIEGLVVGYMVWIFALFAFQDLAGNISNEAEVGTLEQLYLSPCGFWWVNLSLMAARFVTNIIWIGSMLLVMMITSGYWLHIDLVSLFPIIMLTVAACYGLGFIMGGLALIFKRIQSSFQILQFIFVAFVAVPINQYTWIKYLPLTMGNNLMRQVMVDGTRLWHLPTADLIVTTVVGIGYFLLGIAVFSWCINVARKQGLMGHY